MNLIVSSFFRTVAVFLCCAAGVAVFRHARKKKYTKKDIYFGLLLFYLIYLFFITVYRDGLMTGTGRSLNFRLFADPFRMLRQGFYFHFIYLFVGNIVWFIPMGYLLPHKIPLSFWRMVLWGFLISLAIEGLQYFFAAGVSELDDLVLNTVGTAVGYGLYCLQTKRRKDDCQQDKNLIK